MLVLERGDLLMASDHDTITGRTKEAGCAQETLVGLVE